jgi:phage regulator Rha-like protein
MEIVSQVEIYEDEARSGSFLLAQGLDREHYIVVELIKKYREDFDDFGELPQRKLKSTGGRAAVEYMLDADQFMFLGTLLKNTTKVVAFKKEIIKQFKKARKQLELLSQHRQQPEYQITREAGKIVRREATDTMQEFMEYAKAQGSQNADRYYSNISKMLNSLLFIVEGRHKTLRNMLTVQQLMTVSSAEQIVAVGLKIGMANKKFYKDIYLDVKEKVQIFADLHGKSEVLDRQLAIE